MKKRMRALFLTAIIFMMGVCAYAAENVPFRVSRNASSVVRITVNNQFGTEEVTGIVIGKGLNPRYILTSLAAVEGYQGDIYAGVNAQQNVKAVGIAASSKAADIAVLEMEEDLKNVKIAKFKKGDVKDGTEVYALGYYSKDDNSVITEGAVNSKNSINIVDSKSTDVYLITAQMSERNKGGALVDKNGDVVGVNFYDGNVNQNKAVTSGEVINMLNENDIPYKEATIIFPLFVTAVILAVLLLSLLAVRRIVKKKKAKQPAVIGVSGEFAGERISLGSENINIGRDAKSCQVIILDDPKVSRCHCSVRYDGMRGMFAITDLSSTHGTYINGSDKLEPKVPVYIPDGTVFRLGDGVTSFRVSTGGGN